MNDPEKIPTQMEVFLAGVKKVLPLIQVVILSMAIVYFGYWVGMKFLK